MATKKADPKPDTVELPAPPEGHTYVLVADNRARGGFCPSQTCPLHLDDPIAYSKSPGFDVVGDV